MKLVADKENRSVVVRITDVCNNKCAHCCFSCGPTNKLRMSVEIARQINSLFHDTDQVAWWFNIMGGEPTILKNYEEILESFAGRNVRLVTNGWWINRENHKDRFLSFIKSTKVKVKVGVSRDGYHPKGVGTRAFDFLMANKVEDDWGLTTPNPNDEEASLVSVGRAYDNGIGYMRSAFGCYCQSSNTRNTSFTVLEDGTVTFCPFGIYPIGFLEDGVEHLDAERQRLRGLWDKHVMSCRSCYEAWLFKYGRLAVEKGYSIYDKTSL